MENLENEIWLPVVGYEGLYEVSSVGRIKSLDRIVDLGRQINLMKGKLFIVKNDKYGYPKTAISKNKIIKHTTIHRLVAQAFIPNPENKPQVNHRNGIKTDNRVENLEWCTNKENMQHAHRTGIKVNKGGENHQWAKLSVEDVEYIRRNYNHKTCKLKDLAKRFSVCEGTISLIKNNINWKV